MTPIDICNMALSALGHERSLTTLADASKEARLCAMWYDAARRNVLGSTFWAGVAVTVGPYDGAAADGGLFRYSTPWCGAALRVEALDDDGDSVEMVRADTCALLLRAPRASFRVAPDSEEPDAWPHEVRLAVVAALASLIALSLTGQRREAADAADRARDALSQARARHANMTRRQGERNRYAAARTGGGWG